MDTDRNYARFYALLARLPGADKDELVYRFTDGRTTHLHLTTPDEYDVLCLCRNGNEEQGYEQRADIC